MGRPSKYNEKLAKKIARLMIEGRSVRKITQMEGMPSFPTICNWLATEDHPFLKHYTRARTVQAELAADEIKDIADDGTNDYMERETRNGSTIVVTNHENINRSRLRVDARKWIAAKLLPKKYGDNYKEDKENKVSDNLKSLLSSIQVGPVETKKDDDEPTVN